jgi:hypothetical protein
MSNYSDPEWRSRFQSGGGFEKPERSGLKRLWEAIKATPRTIGGILRSDPEDLGIPRSKEGPGWGDPAEVAVAEGVEGLGWPDEEAEAGTPRVAPNARAEAGAPEVAPEEERMPVGANIDYILGGSQNDTYSRLRAALSDALGETVTDREMARILGEARGEIFGQTARYGSGYDAVSDFANPDALQALFMYLNG